VRIAIWWEQDSWGGVDSHLLTLLRNWPDKNDRFVVFFNNGNQGMMRISESLRQLGIVELVVFPDPRNFLPSLPTRVIRHFFLPLRFWLMKRRAQGLLAGHGSFDVLLADNGCYPGAWGVLAALWAGAVLGMRVRMLLVHHSAFGRAPFRHGIESLIDFGVQIWSTDLVTVSRATRATLIERRDFFTEKNPIRVIHNGVDNSPADDSQVLELRAALNISSDSFVVAMVGRLERHKGQEDLILAMGELPPEVRARVVAVFVGGGEAAETERLRAIANKIGVASQIRFAGYVEGSTGALMRQFDLLAMLTKDFEGFGLTIAEAMSAGIPVLATRVGAVPEFVSEETAFLVSPEAPGEVAAALVKIISDGNAARSRADRARRHIAKFSGVEMARNFHRLLLVSGG